MTEQQPHSSTPSPWARAGSDDPRASAVPGNTLTLSRPAPRPGSEPLVVRGRGGSGGFAAGNVTGAAPARTPLAMPERDEAATRRRTMLWFGGAAGGVLALGIVILLAMVLTGNNPLQTPNTAAPPDTRSQIAKMCPPPSGAAAPLGPVPATPPGPRTVDSASGISYKSYGGPWQTWHQDWTGAGELRVSWLTGQYFITEHYPRGEYLASILSASVPAATNDALTLDLKCTSKQVAADVRTAYYPQPNTLEPIRDEQTTLGGRPAWVTEFRLHFNEADLKAKDELVAIATIDVGRPNAALLYVSIPGTHRQFDYVVDEVLASIRPTG
jgi:hypothetical protein